MGIQQHKTTIMGLTLKYWYPWPKTVTCTCIWNCRQKSVWLYLRLLKWMHMPGFRILWRIWWRYDLLRVKLVESEFWIRLCVILSTLSLLSPEIRFWVLLYKPVTLEILSYSIVYHSLSSEIKRLNSIKLWVLLSNLSFWILLSNHSSVVKF